MTLQEIALDIENRCRDTVYQDADLDRDGQQLTVSSTTDGYTWEVSLSCRFDIERDTAPTDRGSYQVEILTAAECYIDNIIIADDEDNTIPIADYLPAQWEFQY